MPRLPPRSTGATCGEMRCRLGDRASAGSVSLAVGSGVICVPALRRPRRPQAIVLRAFVRVLRSAKLISPRLANSTRPIRCRSSAGSVLLGRLVQPVRHDPVFELFSPVLRSWKEPVSTTSLPAGLLAQGAADCSTRRCHPPPCRSRPCRTRLRQIFDRRAPAPSPTLTKPSSGCSYSGSRRDKPQLRGLCSESAPRGSTRSGALPRKPPQRPLRTTPGRSPAPSDLAENSPGRAIQHPKIINLRLRAISGLGDRASAGPSLSGG